MPYAGQSIIPKHPYVVRPSSEGVIQSIPEPYIKLDTHLAAHCRGQAKCGMTQHGRLRRRLVERGGLVRGLTGRRGWAGLETEGSVKVWDGKEGMGEEGG